MNLIFDVKTSIHGESLVFLSPFQKNSLKAFLYFFSSDLILDLRTISYFQVLRFNFLKVILKKFLCLGQRKHLDFVFGIRFKSVSFKSTTLAYLINSCTNYVFIFKFSSYG
ncbi:hypothetical protein DDT91_20515 [Algoriphagus sp. AK58]|nr:hypothetical protein [Algoriphagus sp. AK58]